MNTSSVAGESAAWPTHLVVNFFDGMMLTAADLAAEQEYHRGMRYLHNRLHGYGTVSGLEVTVTRGVLVSPGWAIDVSGAEIVVAQPLALRLEPRRDARPWVRDLVIEWHETPDNPVSGPEGATDFSPLGRGTRLSLVLAREGRAEALVLRA